MPAEIALATVNSADQDGVQVSLEQSCSTSAYANVTQVTQVSSGTDTVPEAAVCSARWQPITIAARHPREFPNAFRMARPAQQREGRPTPRALPSRAGEEP